MQNTFYQITLVLPQEAHEAVANFLFEHAAQGIEEKDDALLAFFAGDIDADDLLIELSNYVHELRELLDIDFKIDITLDEKENQDWNAEWKKSYKPIRITDNILIKPSWYDTPADAPPIVIEIDPKMAFGSGTHGTTSTILKLLEKQIKPTHRILDMGTGTGILTIAAVKLGAAHVTAFDNDPIATETAMENAEINRVSDHIHFFTGTIDDVKEEFDIIAANVNSKVLSSDMAAIIKRCKTDGTILLSGILRTQEEEMRAVIQQHQLYISDMLYQDEWISFETRN